jgi:hypothetical protein
MNPQSEQLHLPQGHTYLKHSLDKHAAKWSQILIICLRYLINHFATDVAFISLTSSIKRSSKCFQLEDAGEIADTTI